jgi:hypothetical protein
MLAEEKMLRQSNDAGMHDVAVNRRSVERLLPAVVERLNSAARGWNILLGSRRPLPNEPVLYIQSTEKQDILDRLLFFSIAVTLGFSML